MARFVTFIADPELESSVIKAIATINGELVVRGVSIEQIREAMKLNIQSSRTYDITSTDSKTPDLKKKYGSDIFGLQPDSRKEIQETIMNPGLVSHIKTVTGL